MAAMIRAVWDASYWNRIPDFSEPPYDLGGFETIVHRAGAERGADERVRAAFEVAGGEPGGDPFKAEVTFGARLGTAMPDYRRISHGGCWIEQVASEYAEDRTYSRFEISFGTSRQTWGSGDLRQELASGDSSSLTLPPFSLALHAYWFLEGKDRGEIRGAVPRNMDTEHDGARLQALISHFEHPDMSRRADRRPYASAPIRSEPQRTYSPGSSAPTVRGSHAPYYLAQLSQRSPSAWERLKERLCQFGKRAGLFEELIPHRWRTGNGDGPFEIRLRLPGQRASSSLLNLADVGYGVSQVLPIVTDLLREDGPPMMILQEPEVHLHPSAAAALGTLFCDVTAEGRENGRQLVVETHSDFIIDRCLLAVRRGVLRSEDLSIVYFRRSEDGVTIHNIEVNEKGRYQDYPKGFRQFFLEETAQFLESD